MAAGTSGSATCAASKAAAAESTGFLLLGIKGLLGGIETNLREVGCCLCRPDIALGTQARFETLLPLSFMPNVYILQFAVRFRSILSARSGC